MLRRLLHITAIAGWAALVLAGCSGGGISLTDTISAPPANAPPTGPVVERGAAPDDAPAPEPGTGYAVTAGSVITVYSRVASGLNSCWLKDGRPLGTKYILHADVAPPPSDSAAITIHVRNKEGRRGLKAYLVALTAVGDQTRVLANNVKLSKAQATRIASDIVRWSRGERACEPEAGWSPAPTRQTKVETAPPIEPRSPE